MIKFFAILFMLISTPSFAQTSNAPLPSCWQCDILEGIYIYVFNFVYKLYDVFVPIVLNLLWLTMAFWFIWYIWTNIIKPQKTDVNTLFKDVFVKLFTYTFVISLLSLPAREIFKYSIEPIMNAGPSFAKWVLESARNDTEMLKLANNRIKNFSCDDIKLKDYSVQALNNFKKTSLTNDEMNIEENTLINLLCITREYGNTYMAGTDLGMKIMARSAIAMGEFKVSELVYNSTLVQSLETALQTALGSWGILYNILMFLLKVWLFLTYIANVLTFFIGLCISVGFLYILFTYLITILDVVVKLAMVGVMMPITIGAWTFKNTRSKLSTPLFFNVVKATFRVGFLSVSMTITTYLLNELLTINFNAGNMDITLTDLLSSLSGNGKILTASTFLDGFNLLSTKNQVLFTILFNPTIIISTLFVCLICYTLIAESVKTADKFSSVVKSGISEDVVLNGLKKITISTIKYIKGGVKREVYQTLSQPSNKDDKKKNAKPNKDDPLTIYDIPVEDAIKLYENRNDLSNTSFANNTNYKVQPFDELKKDYEVRSKKYSAVRQKQDSFLNENLSKYENYNKLDKEEQSLLHNAILSDDVEVLNTIKKNPKINDVVNEINLAIPNKKEDSTPFADIKQDLYNKELEDYIRNDKTISKTQRQKLNRVIFKGEQPSPKTRQLLDKIEAEVKSNNYKEQKRLEEMKQYILFRENLNKYKRNDITAKDLFIILKRERLKFLQNQIDEELKKDPNDLSYLKVSKLKRDLKKLQKTFDEMDEYDEDMFESLITKEIKDYKRNHIRAQTSRAEEETKKRK